MNEELLNSVYRLRMSSPEVVQQLWDAVRVIRYQHQIPTQEKIIKYMSKIHSVSEEEVIKQLHNCVRDGLLLTRKSKGSKGSKVGVEQESYKLPEPENDDKIESYDWYCFQCKTGGDVIPCQGCHRVYHFSCTTNLHGNEDKYICTICQSCDEDNSLAHIRLRKLSRLLVMVATHLKDKYSAVISSGDFLRRSIFIGSPGAQLDIGGPSESWRLRYLVYRPMDLATMLTTAKAQKYPNIAAFLAHAQSIVHSVVIFHGGLSDLAVTSRQMLRECQAELIKVRACPSCYEAAVLKQKKHWFCKPCKPPHTLVFAGSPYMPAKVLQEKDDKLDVVFFGPKHTRMTVDRDSTQPITTSVSHLGKNKSDSWSKAMSELAKHQDMLSTNQYSSSDSDDDIVDKVPKEVERPPPKEPIVTPASTKSLLVKRERYSSDEDDEDDVKRKKVVQKKRRGRPPKTSAGSATITPTTQSNSTTPPGPSTSSKTPSPPILRRKSRSGKRGRPKRKNGDDDDDEDPIEEKMEDDSKDDDKAKSESLAEEVKQETRRAESPTTTVSAPTSLKKNEEEIVSSSCMEPQVRCIGTQTSKKEKPNKEVIAKIKDEMEGAHAEEIKTLKETHVQEIAATKKKQWCYNCEQEAIYHCCWNTAYCSTECQQVHWQKEHKRVCRRKR